MMSRGGLVPLAGPLAGPLGSLGPLAAPLGLFHHLDPHRDAGPTTPPLSMTTIEDLAYHYRYSLYQFLPPLPPPGLGLPALPGGLSQGLSCYEPLSLLSCTPPPLDLSVKAVPPTPITPPSTPSPASPTSRKRNAFGIPLSHPALTPAKLDLSNNNDESVINHNVSPSAPSCPAPSSVAPPSKRGPPSSASKSSGGTPAKKTKAVRKLTFDEDKSSPVSGTIIRDIDEVVQEHGDSLVVRKGDIDPAFNVVEVTEEAKAELAAIENKIGDYVCRLCRELYDDAFSLAQHRCSCIVHVEYRCPECDKVFNCPANLASHRRWHKPRQGDAVKPKSDEPEHLTEHRPELLDAKEGDAKETQPQIPCPVCHKRFRRQAYLRKHLATHSSPLPGFTNLDVQGDALRDTTLEALPLPLTNAAAAN
ncbi:insulinoma-associated protein 1a-like [Frankliniella occidentalis]|uniref:Insulinoma-associated protein 1a-like n=1 Tax=Frankliniella occidentalis TaxID=133901 RepID=A0A6J1SBN3_FRAOC|nr:insulinoma-associated protein 1a-like [Frankliniella occidentalis]